MFPRSSLVGLGLLVTGATTLAQNTPAGPETTGTVVITDVEFDQNVGTPRWTSIAIELDPTAPRGETYVNDVGVRIVIGYPLPDNEFLFFESEVEIIAMEQGQDQVVVFMLPRQIVDQYRLPSEPPFWEIELSVGERDIPGDEDGQANRLSTSLSSPALVQGFRERAAAGLSETENTLLPIYLSPYPPTLVDSDPPAYRRPNPLE